MYLLSFCLKNEKGTRTTHHLVFVSKHPLGYEVIKRIPYPTIRSALADCRRGNAW